MLQVRAYLLSASLVLMALGSCRQSSVQGAGKAGSPGVDPAVLARFRTEYNAAAGRTRPVFDKFLPILGPKPLLDFVESTAPACHIQAHDLGRAIFARTRDLETALGQCDTRCTSGCMHGVVTEAFGESSEADITAQMNRFCGEGAMSRLHSAGNCAHGIGHALMFVTSGDVRRAVDGCLGFDTQPLQYYCATGVFMEQFLDRGDSAVGPGLEPCDAEVFFPGACYRYKGAFMLKALGDRRAVAAVCGKLDELQRRGCYHGLGYTAIQDAYADPRSISSVCARGDKDDRVACVEGVIEKLAELNEGRAKAACAFLEDERRPVCDEAVGRKMYGLDKPTFPLYYDSQAIARRRAQLVSSASRQGRNDHRH